MSTCIEESPVNAAPAPAAASVVRSEPRGGEMELGAKNNRLAISKRGIEPSNANELFQIARTISASGLAPKSMNSPEAVFVALEMGLELGMPMMMSLRAIAVINNRPSIYGDAALALVRSSGLLESFREWFEVNGKKLTTADGDPRSPTIQEIQDETCTAFCRVKRLRDEEPLVYSFSVGDAKQALLLAKEGPWRQYPARMLKFRARGFALRDKFGDVLQGMYTAEEADDIPAERVVITQPSNGSATSPMAAKMAEMRAKNPPTPQPSASAAAAPIPPVNEVPHPGDPNLKIDMSTGQVMDDGDAPQTETRDETPATETKEPERKATDWTKVTEEQAKDLALQLAPAGVTMPHVNTKFRTGLPKAWDKLSPESKRHYGLQIEQGRFVMPPA